MMLEIPPLLESVILSHLKKSYFLKKNPNKNYRPDFTDKDLKYFSRGAERLSTAFTEERASLPLDYFNDPVLRSGYLLYFLPINLLKVYRVLNEINPVELVTGHVRVLDVGCGQGTAMLSVMSFYAHLFQEKKMKEVWLEFTLVDKNFSVLKEALLLQDAYKKELQKKYPGFHSTCVARTYDLRRRNVNRFLRNIKFHLVIASHVLNEFPDRKSQNHLSCELFLHLDLRVGKFILIEPATKKASRDLQHVRDELVVHQKMGRVLSPCLHQQICPLNVVNKRDWCHFYFSWQPSKLIQKVDRLIGNKKNFLACSYLLLAPFPSQPLDRPRHLWRVISNVMPTNGKKEVVLCGPAGRYHLSRLDRNASLKNKDFDQMKRGKLVIYNPSERNEVFNVDARGVIGSNDSIELVKDR